MYSEQSLFESRDSMRRTTTCNVVITINCLVNVTWLVNEDFYVIGTIILVQ